MGGPLHEFPIILVETLQVLFSAPNGVVFSAVSPCGISKASFSVSLRIFRCCFPPRMGSFFPRCHRVVFPRRHFQFLFVFSSLTEFSIFRKVARRVFSIFLRGALLSYK